MEFSRRLLGILVGHSTGIGRCSSGKFPLGAAGKRPESGNLWRGQAAWEEGSGRGGPAVAASDSEEVETVQTAVPRAAFRCHEAGQAPPKHQRSVR